MRMCLPSQHASESDSSALDSVSILSPINLATGGCRDCGNVFVFKRPVIPDDVSCSDLPEEFLNLLLLRLLIILTSNTPFKSKMLLTISAPLKRAMMMLVISIAEGKT